ncbi:MAG: hypothetical protein ACRCS6_03080 [Turicibacter sp.]
MSKINVENNSDDNDLKDYNYYFPLFMGVGLIFGVVLNQIAIGLCLGVVCGLTLDYKKKK